MSQLSPNTHGCPFLLWSTLSTVSHFHHRYCFAVCSINCWPLLSLFKLWQLGQNGPLFYLGWLCCKSNVRSFTFPQSYHIQQLLTISHDCQVRDEQHCHPHPLNKIEGQINGSMFKFIKKLSCQYFLPNFWIEFYTILYMHWYWQDLHWDCYTSFFHICNIYMALGWWKHFVQSFVDI